MYIFFDYSSDDIKALSISLTYFLHNDFPDIYVMQKHASMQTSEILISKLRRKANYFNGAEIQFMATSIHAFLQSLKNDNILEFVRVNYGSIHDLYFRVYRLNAYFEEILNDQYCQAKIYAS